MIRRILTFITVLIATLFAAQTARSQGTFYASNLGQDSTTGAGIASDYYYAELIETGNNPDGYLLNAVQLLMGTAIGTPSGFVVSIYSDVNGYPSQDIAELAGSSNPSSAGTYTYTASDLLLTPSTGYFIVAAAATPIAQAAYVWLGTSGDTEGLDGWSIQPDLLGPNDNDEEQWTGTRGEVSQTAIYATTIPEPSAWVLCLLGGGLVFAVRSRKRTSA